MDELIKKIEKMIRQYQEGLTLDYECLYQMLDEIMKYLESIGKE